MAKSKRITRTKAVAVAEEDSILVSKSPSTTTWKRGRTRSTVSPVPSETVTPEVLNSGIEPRCHLCPDGGVGRKFVRVIDSNRNERDACTEHATFFTPTRTNVNRRFLPGNGVVAAPVDRKVPVPARPLLQPSPEEQEAPVRMHDKTKK